MAYFNILQHSYCLSLLADYLKPGMSVLDIGSGSGYLTAVFGLMVRKMQEQKFWIAIAKFLEFNSMLLNYGLRNAKISGNHFNAAKFLMFPGVLPRH